MNRSAIAFRSFSVVPTRHSASPATVATAVGAILAATMLGASDASAQATEPAATSKQHALEEIIVTARFREEKLQETPIAITALNAEEIQLRGFSSAYEVAYTVPNASFRPAQAAFGSTMTAFIRGIGQYDFDFAFEPGVAIYIDDVYHPFTLGSQIDLLDLDRVEVLRGPQGTLSGRGSIGGAIRYYSKQPQGDDTGSVEVTYGDFDRLDIRASYDFKLTDNLFARVSGVSKRRDGHQDVIDFACKFPDLAGPLGPQTTNRGSNCKVGTQGGEEVAAGRAALRWVANEDFDITLSADYTKDSSEAKADTLTQVNTASFPSLVPGLPYDERFLPPNPYVSYATYSDPLNDLRVKPQSGMEKWTVSGRADWDINDNLNTTLILAYTELTSTLSTDGDVSPINMQTVDGVQDVDFFTAELRFGGRVFDRMDWTLGGFLYDGTSVNDQMVSIPFLSLILDGVPPDDGSRPFVNAHNSHDNSNESLFGHVVFDVTDRFSLNAGLRYSSDEKDVDFDNTRVQNPNVVVEGSHTDWRVGADFKFTDSLMTYASASTGYRPGSYNPRPFQATQVVAVEAEESTAYELGIKSDLFDRQLRLNAAIFYTDYETRITPTGGTECLLLDLGPPPVYDTVPPGTPGAVTDSLGNTCLATVSRTFYENTPGEIRGFEIEATWEPIEGLRFNGSYGKIDWDSPDINDDPTVVSDRPTYVPEDNWAFSASYAATFGNGSTLTPRVDVYGQSEICSQTSFVAGTPGASAFPDASCTDAYELVNVRLEWASPDRAWTAAVGATNVGDKEFYLNKFDLTAFGQPHAEGQPGRPREWYITLGRNF